MTDEEPRNVPDGASTSRADEWGFDTTEAPRRESCVKFFDALWFCYSPVYQMQQLYRYGEVDDCTGRWRDFYDCLKLRTKFAHEVVEDPDKGKSIWKLRTPEEAATWWQSEFGHLRGQQEAADSAERKTPAGSGTTILSAAAASSHSGTQ